MSRNVYDYMDWPRIEAIVYGEEASPKDVMSPRLCLLYTSDAADE